MSEEQGHSLDRFLSEHPPGEYMKAWVACLDILGYKSLLGEGRDPRRALEIVSSLRLDIATAHLGNEIAQADGLIDGFRIFSDTIYLATHEPLHVLNFVYVLTDLVGRLAASGIFLRGAATYDNHYDDGVVLFSPAFARAFEMEQQEAFHPRVIADATVTRSHRAFASTIPDVLPDDPDHAWREENRLWQDTDGRCFVNYLMVTEDVRAHCSEEQGRAILADHRGQVTANLEKHRDNPRVLAKYHWLANYHNRFCRFALSEDEREGLLINTGAIRSGAER